MKSPLIDRAILGAVPVNARPALVLSVVVSVTFFSGCAGGDSNAPTSVDGVRTCLEGSGADVVTPLRPEAGTFSFGLRGSGWTSAGLVRPPGGTVGMLAFYATEDIAAELAESLRNAQLGPLLSQPIDAERHRNAVLVWRRPVREVDRSLVTACLESNESSAVAPDDGPAQPLGCVQVFIRSPSTPTQVAQVDASLRAEPLAREVQLLSKEKAFEHMRQKFPELTANLHENPLPDAFRVGPRRGDDAPQLASLVRRHPRAEIVLVSALPCSFIEPSLTS